MWMDLAVTGVDHQPFIVRFIYQHFKQSFPYVIVAPSKKTAMRIAPASKVRRKITPGSAGTHNPKNRIDEQSIVMSYSAPTALATW
jgi:hypothetical protein